MASNSYILHLNRLSRRVTRALQEVLRDLENGQTIDKQSRKLRLTHADLALIQFYFSEISHCIFPTTVRERELFLARADSFNASEIFQYDALCVLRSIIASKDPIFALYEERIESITNALETLVNTLQIGKVLTDSEYEMITGFRPEVSSQESGDDEYGDSVRARIEISRDPTSLECLVLVAMVNGGMSAFTTCLRMIRSAYTSLYWEVRISAHIMTQASRG